MFDDMGRIVVFDDMGGTVMFGDATETCVLNEGGGLVSVER
jgi:hypothetical protein